MAWVQAPAAVNASAASIAATFGSSTPAGNLIVVCVTQDSSSALFRSITNVRDNVDTGVDYSLAVGNVQNPSGNNRLDIYYKVAASAGTRTVTVSFSGGSPGSALAISEYDSAHTALGPTNSNSSDTGTSATPGAASPSGTATYFVGIADFAGGTITPTTAWDQRAEIESNGTCTIAIQDKVTTGSQNPAITVPSGAWVAAIVTFEAALPTFSLQPVDQTIASGSTASFDTTVSGATSYQWETLDPLGGSWGNVSGGSGGTTADYTTPTLTTSDRGKQYRLKASNSNGDTYSNVVGVRITDIPTSYDFGGFVIGANS